MNYNYQRRTSSEVKIGNTPLGASHPVRLQSMTNTSTMDTEGSIAQTIRIIQAGGAYVRLTAQGVREAENLKFIHEGVRAAGYENPLVADIHFNPRAADAAALYVEKVRINPGNYVDSARTFKELEYTDEEYAAEIQKIRDRFIPFLDICREHGTAIRIGVNHGSLSDRIMSRYGDTPGGMVESCMEFLRICVEQRFMNVVLSIKASNTVVMVRTVRLLVQAMEREGMAFPLHLGVTEAGDGEDGRIKSAVGIGALLTDGLGDTIRVSLSEAPETEIPVARKLVEYVTGRAGHDPIEAPRGTSTDEERRPTRAVGNAGGSHLPVVVADYSETEEPLAIANPAMTPDYIWLGAKEAARFAEQNSALIDSYDEKEQIVRLKSGGVTRLITSSHPGFIAVTLAELASPDVRERIAADPELIVLAGTTNRNIPGEHRAILATLDALGIANPVILCTAYAEEDAETLQVKMGADYGANLIDRLADGIMVSNRGSIATAKVTEYMFGTLQAARLRTTKTEYISCPGCGRTLFDLQTTIARVKAATSHLTGLKIGIMGCIVNGPGEMADADYGYVGAGRGKVSLYKNKTCLEKNIPEEEAVTKLIELIKAHGDWTD